MFTSTSTLIHLCYHLLVVRFICIHQAFNVLVLLTILLFVFAFLRHKCFYVCLCCISVMYCFSDIFFIIVIKREVYSWCLFLIQKYIDWNLLTLVLKFHGVWFIIHVRVKLYCVQVLIFICLPTKLFILKIVIELFFMSVFLIFCMLPGIVSWKSMEEKLNIH